MKRHYFSPGLFLWGIPLVFLMVLTIRTEDTWALYSSQAVSSKNSLHGGSIELSVTPDSGNSSEDATFTLGSSFVYGMVVDNEGRNALRYHIRPVSPDGDLCGALMLSARLDDAILYEGPLLDFSYAATALEKGDDARWQFSLTLPNDVSFDNGATCELSLRFEAWQSYAFSLGMGWYDEVEMPLPQMSFDPSENREEQLEAVQEGVEPLLPLVENEESEENSVQGESTVPPESQPSSEISDLGLEEEAEKEPTLEESVE